MSRARPPGAANASPSRHTLGRAVAHLRKQRGQTQAALAAKAGLNRGYVAGIERGARNPTSTSIGNLAGGLDVSVSELVLVAEALDDVAPG